MGDDQGNTIFEEAVSFKNFKQEAETRENARMNRMRSAVDSGSSKQTDIASAPAAAGSPEDSQSESDEISKYRAKARAEAKAKAARKRKRRKQSEANTKATEDFVNRNLNFDTRRKKRTTRRTTCDKAFRGIDNIAFDIAEELRPDNGSVIRFL